MNKMTQFKRKKGCSQYLKGVPQNFMEVFKVDAVTANDVINKKKTSLKKRKTTDFP